MAKQVCFLIQKNSHTTSPLINLQSCCHLPINGHKNPIREKPLVNGCNINISYPNKSSIILRFLIYHTCTYPMENSNSKFHFSFIFSDMHTPTSCSTRQMRKKEFISSPPKYFQLLPMKVVIVHYLLQIMPSKS